MHDFFCKTAGDMLSSKLSAKVGYMKDEGGVGKMCELMKKVADKEVHEDRIATAKILLESGSDIELIVKSTRLSREEVEEIAKRIA